MSILVKWDNNTSGPLTKGWIPAGLTHTSFPSGFSAEIEDNWLVGQYSGTLESLATYGLEEYTVPEVGVEYPSKITRLAFLSRFTDAEAIAIDLASIDDPTADMATRTQQASIRRFLNKVGAASHIDLSLPETIAGVSSLNPVFIDDTRQSEILDRSTISEGELYEEGVS